MRVFLLLITGLRSGDVETLTVADIDFEKNTVDTRSRKTRKHMLYRPLPADAMPELIRYAGELPEGPYGSWQVTVTRTRSGRRYESGRVCRLCDCRIYGSRFPVSYKKPGLLR